MKFILILLSAISLNAVADDQVVLDGGLGVFGSSRNGLAETRMISVAAEETLWYSIKDRANIGGWLDDSGSGRSSSAFVSGQLGFEVDRDGTVGTIYTGPCIISSPDSMLGGYLQFMTDFHFGIHDRDSNYMGIFYRHISSANLSSPNLGRDIMGVEVRF